MTKEREFLYDLTISEVDLRGEEFEIEGMSSLEVATALHEAGLNSAQLVRNVRTTTDAMRKNAMIAEQMNIGRIDVRRRALLLSLMALVGLAAVLIAFVGGAIAPEGISEAARKLFVLLLVGGIGLFLISLLATLYVLWNAFVHKTILAEVAIDEASELITEIEKMRAQEPTATMTQLVIKLEQNPVWSKHHAA